MTMTPKGKRRRRLQSVRKAQPVAATEPNALGTAGTPEDSTPADAPAEAPDTASPAVTSPGTVIDSVLDLGGSDVSADVDAAAAAIDVVNIPNNTLPGSDAPATAPAADNGFRPWSKTRLQRASRKQVIAYARELEAKMERQPARPAGSDADPVPLGDVTSMEHTLRQMMPGVNEGIAYLAGESFRHDDEQSELLVKGLAPALAPHYDRLRVTLPWLPAGIAVLGVYLPKVFDHLRAEKLRRAEAGDVAPATDSAQTSLALVPESAPAVLDAKPAPARAEYPRPYGGPRE